MKQDNKLRSIPVAYTPKQVSCPSSFSPSPRKPGRVVRGWQEAGYPISTIEPAGLHRSDFESAHDPSYVSGIFDLTIRNGFGGLDATVAESLRYTSGSMYLAARLAAVNGRVAISPTSGFHHAGYAHGGGFCTFNGLMIAAIQLREEGVVRKVGVLDCDQHYGDGTQDIIDKLKLGSAIRQVSAGRHYRRNAKEFLAALPGIVFAFAGCDLLLYQAGADPHIDDPLGGWLTTAQLFERDRIVFSMANSLGLPVAWNLAGGYQEPIEKILEIHDNTLRACLAEYLDLAIEAPPNPVNVLEALDTNVTENCHVRKCDCL